MPITTTFRPEHKLVISKYQGIVSDDEFKANYENMYADPEWRPEYSELADIREANIAKITSTAIQWVSKLTESFIKDKNPSYRTAVVVPNDHNFGMARMYQTYSDESNEELRIFREIDTALEWLGIAPDTFDL